MTLVAMGVAILLAAGVRFLAYGRKWYRMNPRHVWYHTPWLAFSFAMLVAAFGVVLLVFRQQAGARLPHRSALKLSINPDVGAHPGAGRPD